MAAGFFVLYFFPPTSQNRTHQEKKTFIFFHPSRVASSTPSLQVSRSDTPSPEIIIIKTPIDNREQADPASMCWFCTGHRANFFFFFFFSLHDFDVSVCVCARFPVFLDGLLVCKPLLSHVLEEGLPQASHHVPSRSSLFLTFLLSPSPSLSRLSIHSPSFLSLSPLASAPVLSTPAPAAPISAQRCWLEPMLHLACPLRPWGHTWRAKARRAPAQARLPWPGGARSRRISGELWAGGRPARVLSQ